jgi:alkanesulfonate monooxygenase
VSASFFWTLPVEGRRLGPYARHAFVTELRDERRDRFTPYDHLLQVARAAESAGFTGAFVPWDERGEDSWIVAASLAREVRRLSFLPELQPGFTTPVYLAKLSASFQRLSGGRLAWKLDLERDPAVRRAHGDHLTGAEWFTRAGEFLTAAKGVWSHEPYDYEGRFFAVEKGGLKGPLAGHPRPPIYTGGRSDEALAFAARHADVHLLDGDDLAAVRVEIDRLDQAFAQQAPALIDEARANAFKRTLKRGIRLTVVARHTADEAREAVHRVGWQSRKDLVAGTHEQVARRIDELTGLGIEVFVLEGSPHLEEAYRIGEHVFPKLTARARPAARVVRQEAAIHVH